LLYLAMELAGSYW